MRRPLSILPGLALAAGALHAQADSTHSARDTLAAVIVTATRVAVATAEPTSATTVLQGDELRAQGISRVVDALRLVPAASVVESGPIGSQTSLFLRGGNSNDVRVLIDGVAVNDAGGGFDFASLTLDNVDRIEVVRGPASVLYGSDAVTGVVQIFTRDGRGPLAMHAAAGAGSRGTVGGELGVAGGDGRAGFTLDGAHHATDGILAFNNRFVDDALSGTLRFAPDASTSARLSARWTASIYHYPTDYAGNVVDHNAEQSDHRFVTALSMQRRLGDRVDARMSLTSDEFLPRDNNPPDSPADTLGYFGFFSRDARTHREGEAMVDVRYGRRGVLTIGGDAARDRESSTSVSLSQYGNSSGGFDASRHNTGVYLQALGDGAERFSYALGARLDRNSAFGSFQTVRASVAWAASGALRLRAAAGSAFKAPSFFENFSTGYVQGNPSLRPERSRSAEVGADAFLFDGTLTVRTTAYRQQLLDLVDYSPTASAPGAPNYFNVAAADANGVELDAAYTGIAHTRLSAAYAWTDTRTTRAGFDSTSGATYAAGQRLIRRPPQSVTLSVSRTYGSAGRVELVAARVGERDDRDFAAYPTVPVRLPAYTKLDLSLDAPIGAWVGERTVLTGRVDNLLGANYSEIYHFPAPGRMLYVGVRIGR